MYNRVKRQVVTQADFTELYPMSGNSPWVKKFISGVFLSQYMANSFFWAQTDHNIIIKVVILSLLMFEPMSHVIGSDTKIFL